MRKWMYSCAEAARLSSRALEEPLKPSERVLLRMHLMMCRGCTNFARQLDFLRRTAHKLPAALDKDVN